MQKLLGLLFIFSLASGIGIVWHYTTAGFKRGKIHCELPSDARWHIPLSSTRKEEVLKILDQEFTYLGKGRQCFVFQSRDKQYVIKFFRYHLIRPKLEARFLGLFAKGRNYLQKHLQSRKRHFETWMSSYKLSFEELQEENGLIYMHLVQTDELHQKVEIRDSIGRKYAIDLDQAGFCVQKKTDLLPETIEKLIAKKDLSHLKEIIHAYLSVLALRHQKGIKNLDCSWKKNYGNIGTDRIYEIDLGRYAYHPVSVTEKDLAWQLGKYTEGFRDYLKKHILEILPFFDEEIVRVAKENIGSQ